MAQSTKFIDVTRTYLPIDPNSFPESLHGASREDAPEQKIPVMAYKGYNFLPTSYGYKSYFGTAQKIGIDALAARVDHIFIYQNEAYENILIALTDTGVWIKKGETAGAWVNSVVMAPDVNNSNQYLWSHVVIADVLYAYRQGQPSYQKFVHSSTTQLTVTNVVPSFLNMTAQVGIFKAAGRLAFWDTDDSVGWSNLDNFADFSPSLETLAGIVKFADVMGVIVTVLPHGPGFIIYATKSIVFVSQNLENLYQWKPTVILSTTGISYPRQAVAASPDTLHFVYTSEGLKKIDSAREETIVPEVTDFLRDYAGPVYLRVLEGRYLFLEMLDGAYVTGLIQATDEVVPAIAYTFPGSNVNINGAPATPGTPAIPGTPDNPGGTPAVPPTPAVPAVTPSNVVGGICSVMAGINSGAFKDTLPVPPANQSATNKSMKPIWTCYLSRNGVTDNANIVWAAAPCPTVDPNGVDALMSPGSSTLDKMTQTSANKQATTGPQAYADGLWTMERFFQTQTAIWEMEEKNLKSFISAITGRAKHVVKATTVSNCVPVSLVRNECSMGKMVTAYSAPKFGYSTCSFWLTRMAVAAIDLIRVKASTTVCSQATNSFTVNKRAGGTIVGTDRADVCAQGAADAISNANLILLNNRDNYTLGDLRIGNLNDASFTYDYTARDRVEPFTVRNYNNIDNILVSIGFAKSETMSAYNKGVDVADFGVGGIETAFCEITAWSYTTDTGATAITPAGACTAASTYPSPASGFKAGGAAPPVAGKDGYICGNPYRPSVLPGLISVIGGGTGPGDGGAGGPPGGASGTAVGTGGAGGGITVNWPATSVTIPPSSFLLRLGSPAPVYPTFEGALVYDLQLKKWGKMKLRYKQLLNYSPINSTINGVVPSNVFGIMAGALGADGKISLFDSSPADSYISYGKVGYYRGGNTSTEEVHVHFRSLSTGSLTVETSLEGRDLAAGFTKTELFANATEASLYGAYPGRWCNIEIRGTYDINYLEYRGFTQGRR